MNSLHIIYFIVSCAVIDPLIVARCNETNMTFDSQKSCKKMADKLNAIQNSGFVYSCDQEE